jgi:putative endonuclease
VFYTYVAISKSTGKIYIGYTSNILLREKRHNEQLAVKKKAYTYKNKGPWSIKYVEEYATKKEAMIRERQLKSSRGRLFIKNKLSNLVP